MSPRLAPLALLLLASPAAGQAPAPVPPLVLIGSDAVTRAPLAWTLVEPKGVPFEVYGPVVIVRDPVPGTTYRFTVAVTPRGNPPPDPPGPPPEPKPYVPPSPAPDPAPAPIPAGYAGHLRAVLIFEVDEPSTRDLRISKVKDALRALGCDWKVRDSSTVDAQAFRARLEKDGLIDAAGVVTTPVVYLLDDANAIHGDPVKAPTRPDDVINAVKAVRGVK